MTSRKRKNYIAIQELIAVLRNHFLFDLCVNNIIIDFEIALWGALRYCRDNAHLSKNLDIISCLFHFCQAVFVELFV